MRKYCSNKCVQSQTIASNVCQNDCAILNKSIKHQYCFVHHLQRPDEGHLTYVNSQHLHWHHFVVKFRRFYHVLTKNQKPKTSSHSSNKNLQVALFSSKTVIEMCIRLCNAIYSKYQIEQLDEALCVSCYLQHWHLHRCVSIPPPNWLDLNEKVSLSNNTINVSTLITILGGQVQLQRRPVFLEIFNLMSVTYVFSLVWNRSNSTRNSRVWNRYLFQCENQHKNRHIN